jgi:hypothetical protein
MVRAHQPGQAAFRSILPEDIDWEAVSGISAFGTPCRRCQLSEPGPYTISVDVPSGVKLMPHRHPEDRVYTVISGVFFDGDKVRRFRRAALSFCRVTRPISTGQSPVSTSRRSRPLVHLASNTWISAMILARPNFPPRAACPARRWDTRAPCDPTFRVTPRPRRCW